METHGRVSMKSAVTHATQFYYFDWCILWAPDASMLKSEKNGRNVIADGEYQEWN